MEDIMGVINLSNDRDELKELTLHRSKASVPFGGRYRLIDFMLSSMVNSGIKDVSVFTYNKYRSLMDHLGTGNEWDLDRKSGGLFILPPYFEESSLQFKGDLQHFHDHIDFFHRGQQKYVLIASGNLVANIDFRPAFEFHKQSGADITLVYKRIEGFDASCSEYTGIEVDVQNRIHKMSKDNDIQADTVSLDIYIVEKQRLLEMIQENTTNGKYDFLDSLIEKLDQMKVMGYEFQGNATKIDSISTYYIENMRLLSDDEQFQLFHNPAPIYTKVKDEPPAKYFESAEVSNSMIANGCLIEGKVENSILFRGVKVHKGAIIRNSIIMQKTEIGENSVIENAILDKEVFVSPDRILSQESEIPIVVTKKSTI